ncbi:hypothetical protein ACI2LC_09145 [Nonomuraea wenchangensis]|uniref:hypothetical protein n=1 Tax=Nonomuraea wenchangensis TaxID=568860 RepID=UPI0033D3D139
MTAVLAVGSRAGPGTGHAVVAGMRRTADRNAPAVTALQRLAADEDLTLPASELDVQSIADEFVPISISPPAAVRSAAISIAARTAARSSRSPPTASAPSSTDV